MWDGIKIEFTDVLYGVVVANAIYGLTLDLSLQNLMLLFALSVIIGDWIEYQVTSQLVSQTPVAHLTAFVLDFLLLIVWYLLTIVPQGSVEVFFGLLSVFFMLQVVWDAGLLEREFRELVRGSSFQLAGVFCLTSAFLVSISRFEAMLLFVGLGGFLVRKSFN